MEIWGLYVNRALVTFGRGVGTFIGDMFFESLHNLSKYKRYKEPINDTIFYSYTVKLNKKTVNVNCSTGKQCKNWKQPLHVDFVETD